jgi:hypothetical protein
MIKSVGKAEGFRVVAYREVRLPELAIRPDFAIEVDDAIVGYVELKAPGRGVPPTAEMCQRNCATYWAA